MSYQTLKLTIENHVAHLVISNPEKANAMTKAFWDEIKQVMEELDENPEARVVILSGEGKHFTSGIDLNMLMGLKADLDRFDCTGRARENLRRGVLQLQSSFTAIEKCRKPVLAAIHGACIGGGIDMITACDMRYCCDDSYFTIKEIEIGMVADVGTLQRLPKIIGDGIARELAYTGRKVSGQEAEKIHLVNRSYATREEMMEEVLKIAQSIADKSPLSVRGTKEMILYTRDHSVEDSLNYIATWNAAMLFSNDLTEAMTSQMMKKQANFAN